MLRLSVKDAKNRSRMIVCEVKKKTKQTPVWEDFLLFLQKATTTEGSLKEVIDTVLLV